MFGIYLPLPNHSSLLRPEKRSVTRLVALIDHPELTQFSSFPKSPIFMQFKSYYIQFSSKG